MMGSLFRCSFKKKAKVGLHGGLYSFPIEHPSFVLRGTCNVFLLVKPEEVKE
jgi:hypothetical protein